MSPFPRGSGLFFGALLLLGVTSAVIAWVVDKLVAAVCMAGVGASIEIFLTWGGAHLPSGFSCPPMLVSPKPKHRSAPSPLLFGSRAFSLHAQPVANCKECLA